MKLRSWNTGAYAAALCLLVACGGSSLDTVTVPGAGVGGGGASSVGTGGNGGFGALAEGGAPFATNDGGARDANAGASGSGAGAEPEIACTVAADCAFTQSDCSYAICVAGRCALENVAQGTFVTTGVPGDCSSLVCDGQGVMQQIIDRNDTPPSTDCTASDCSVDGKVTPVAVAAGAPCTADGGKRCDGAGKCVACVDDSDCAPNQACTDFVCGPPVTQAPTCSDTKKNQSETDVDCGGACAPCGLARDCYVDSDCESQACDAEAPHRCLADHCRDHRKDADESDTDCGGPCQKCSSGQYCLASTDCTSGVCEFSRGSFCLPDFCVDQAKDGSETDVDCGGGACDGCALGQKCSDYYDCASRACDQTTLQCIADHCADQLIDDGETDSDCGGSTTCERCPLYKHCTAGTDCASGSCTVTVPHLCEP